MILAVDIGNTNIVIGLFKEDILLSHWRISTKIRTPDEYGLIIKNLLSFMDLRFKDIQGMIVSNVVPPISPVIRKMAQSYFRLTPVFIEPGIKTGLAIKYENPKEVGADRIANAIAGVTFYRPPLIIIDFGTATTFDALSKNKEYLGGAIAPGIELSMESLYSSTAKLPRVDFSRPSNIIGKTTEKSIQSGVFYGYLGLIKEIVNEMTSELSSEVTVIATGGLYTAICSHLDIIDHFDETLTLKGLRIIYRLNS